jgi:hypothetical protein
VQVDELEVTHADISSGVIPIPLLALLLVLLGKVLLLIPIAVAVGICLEVNADQLLALLHASQD